MSTDRRPESYNHDLSAIYGYSNGIRAISVIDDSRKNVENCMKSFIFRAMAWINGKHWVHFV